MESVTNRIELSPSNSQDELESAFYNNTIYIQTEETDFASMTHLLPFHKSILRLARSYSTINASYETMSFGGRRKEPTDSYINDDLETFRRRRKTDWKRRQGVRLTFIAFLLTIRLCC